MDDMERRSLSIIDDLRARMLTSAAEMTDKRRAALQDILQSEMKRLLPWVKDIDKDPVREIAQLREAWVAAWGDPSDPEVEEKIWATALSLNPALAQMRR